MNELIMEAARALAGLVADSDAYLLMQRREQEALDDDALQQEYREMMLLRQEAQELSMSDKPDAERLAQIAAELERIKGELQEADSMKKLTEAREGFSSLMGLVNMEIQKVLNPEEALSGGCGGGGCAGCQGCGGR